MRKSLRLFAWALGTSLLAGPAFSQSQATTGQITGRVTDAQGGVLPAATVTISNPATGLTRRVATNEEGLYTFPLLPPGTYAVTSEMSGFQVVKRGGVVVTVGSRVTIDLEMGVAAAQETVTVEAASPLVETTSTIRSATLDSMAIENLPINGRRFQDFVTLTPTAQIDPQRGQISLSGQRGINSNISIDGADFNQPFFGGIRGGERSNTAFTVPQEAIQEFQVVSGGYSAEFGRSSGGIVNAVTKSGTNTFKGSAFYVNRDRKRAEKNAFGQGAAPTQHQFGGSFGGPIQKDKAFFFLAYEEQRLKNRREVLFDRLAGLTPAPTSREAFDHFKALETPFEATNDARTLLARIDYQFNTENRLSIRYSHSSNEALNANATGNALDPNTISALSNNGTEKDGTNVVVGQFTSILSPRLLLEIRGQYSREERPRLANEEQPTVETTIGRFGTVSFLPTTQFDWRAQAAANLTWLQGGHTVKVGTEYNHVFVDQTFGFNQFGRFTFFSDNATILDVLSVGGAIPNRFDHTGVTYLRQLGDLRLDFSTDELAFFAQDSWRLRPHFTVYYGLRWEGAFNPAPEANNQTLIDRVRAVTFPIGRTLDPTTIPDQLDQWGPRLGFAWDATKDTKTVVRGYGGVYYARTPSLIYAAPMNNFRIPPGDLALVLPLAAPGNPNNTIYKQLLLIGIDLNRFPLGQLPVLTVEQVQSIGRALGLAVDPFRGAAPIAVDGDFKNPRALQAGLGFEREIIPGLTVGAEGTVVKTTRLQRNYDLNLPRPTSRANDPAQRPFFGLRSGVQRPVPALGSVQVRESSARSLFRALTLSARVQKKKGQANLYYVLAKSESDDDNERDAGGTGYDNAYDLGPEYGPARLDRRHQFNGNAVLFLPWGFDVASGFSIRSGRPIDATLGRDVNEDLVTNERPYSAPGVPFTRNSSRNRTLKEVNLRVQKGFKFAERQRLVVSLEVFNVFNFENIELAGSAVTNYCATTTDLTCGFGPPTNVNFLQVRDQNRASSRFGQFLLNNNPGAPRQVQMGIRYQF